MSISSLKFQNLHLVPYYDEHDVMVQVIGVRPIGVDESGEMDRVQRETGRKIKTRS